MRIPLRPFATALLGVAAVTCTEGPSAPTAGSGRAATIGFAPVFSKSAARTAALLGQFGISYDHVRIVIMRPPADTVRDTTIVFANGDAALNLDLTVDVRQDGELFDASIDYIGEGGIVFHGHGEVRAHAIDEPAPETPAIILNYAGPGATVAHISITPHDFTLLATDSSRTLTIAAVDSSGASVDPPPFAWTTSDGTIATITSNGTLQPLGHRGLVTVTATTINGLTDAASASLTLPAVSIALVSGGGQSGVVGASLANPAVVQVSAADRIGVAGVAVVFAAPAGGSVNPTSAVTDASGRASATLRLGTAAGPQGFVATALQFSVAIPAAASAGAAAAMAFVNPSTFAPFTGAPALVTLVSGALPSTTPAVKVTDANGNLVAGATLNADFVLGGQSTGMSQVQTDAKGVALLASLAIPTTIVQTAGTYSLVITTPSAPTGTSLTLPMQVLGAVAALRPVNGAVTTIVGSALNASLYPTIVAVDASGTPLPNVSVTFAANGGACTVGAASPSVTVTTDASGRAALSSASLAVPITAPGSCLIESTTPTLSDAPAFVSVIVAPNGAAAWLGGTTDWGASSNWSSGSVPTSSQAVFVPRWVVNHPMLQSAASAGDMTLEASGSLDLNGNTLTLSGNLSANQAGIVDNLSTGGLVLAKGSPGTIDAVVSAPVTIGNAACNGTAYTVTGFFTVSASLTVNCPLDLGAAQLAVIKDLIVQNGGSLTMTQPSVGAVVQGNVTFNGASEAGLLSAGFLQVGGNFTQVGTVSAASFAADSGFAVVLTGNVAHNVSFATPGTGASTSRFADLQIDGGSNVTFVSPVSTIGTLSQNGTINAIAGDTLTFAGVSQFNAGSTTILPTGGAATFMASTSFSATLTVDGGITVVLPGTVTFFAGSQVSGGGTLSLVQGATCSRDPNALFSGLFGTTLTSLCLPLP